MRKPMIPLMNPLRSTVGVQIAGPFIRLLIALDWDGGGSENEAAQDLILRDTDHLGESRRLQVRAGLESDTCTLEVWDGEDGHLLLPQQTYPLTPEIELPLRAARQDNIQAAIFCYPLDRPVDPEQAQGVRAALCPIVLVCDGIS